MSQFFVSGIGTGVGKSFCTAAMLQQAPHYAGIKPVMSGFDEQDAAASDAGQLLRAMKRPINMSEIRAISPFCFKAPLSPHLAAIDEGRAINPRSLLHFCTEQMAQHRHLLIEGVGGLMVPMTPDWLVLNWIEALKLPVILVGSTYLGAINHTLLTLEALKQANIVLHALIVSQSAQDCAGLERTCGSIETFLPDGAMLRALPRQKAWNSAPSLLSLLQ